MIFQPAGSAKCLNLQSEGSPLQTCRVANFALAGHNQTIHQTPANSIANIHPFPSSSRPKLGVGRSDFHRNPPRPSARRQTLRKNRGTDHRHSLYTPL
ncbi:hypothetical protein QR685DRAFT_525566 [Neurospora intermedia]|uniref:Uncharacterized protein n=1 Tax=Neurospora intermedia TaxID=5142 RepID=A0ABR3DEM6_NEUIN